MSLSYPILVFWRQSEEILVDQISEMSFLCYILWNKRSISNELIQNFLSSYSRFPTIDFVLQRYKFVCWTWNVFISTLVQMFIFQCFWARTCLSRKQCAVIFYFTRDTVHYTVVLNRVSTSVLWHTWQRLRTTALKGLSKIVANSGVLYNGGGGRTFVIIVL